MHIVSQGDKWNVISYKLAPMIFKENSDSSRSILQEDYLQEMSKTHFSEKKKKKKKYKNCALQQTMH